MMVTVFVPCRSWESAAVH